MNPSESLSFTRLIKSLVPGVILIFHYLLLLEVGGLLLSGRHSRLVQALISNAISATLFLSVLLPIALILGFLLNTVWWVWFGDFVKNQTRSRLHPKIQQMYRHIKQCARRQLEESVPVEEDEAATDEEAIEPGRRSLADRLFSWLGRPAVGLDEELPVDVEAFLLPVLQREKYGLVKESYFAWYEFQANSCLAVVFAYLLFLLSAPWAGTGDPAFLLQSAQVGQVVGPIVQLLLITGFLSAAFIYVLARAAISNLRRHHHFMLWFLMGSVEVTNQGTVCLRHWEQEAVLEPDGPTPPE